MKTQSQRTTLLKENSNTGSAVAPQVAVQSSSDPLYGETQVVMRNHLQNSSAPKERMRIQSAQLCSGFQLKAPNNQIQPCGQIRSGHPICFFDPHVTPKRPWTLEHHKVPRRVSLPPTYIRAPEHDFPSPLLLFVRTALPTLHRHIKKQE